MAVPPPERRFSSPQAQRALLPADDQGASNSEAMAIERGLWPLFKTAITQWIAHKDARLGAALAYYSIFSLGPLIIIAIAIAGFFFGQELVRGEVLNNLKALLGDTGVKAVEGMLGADKHTEGIVATIIGIATLIFAAVGVVVQLKDALNTVWEVKTPPSKGIWGFARTYVLSFAGVRELGQWRASIRRSDGSKVRVGNMHCDLFITSVDASTADQGLQLARKAINEGVVQ